MKDCAVCENKAISKGLCGPHYQKWRKYGNPLCGKTKRERESINKPGTKEYILENVIVDDSECWIWQRGKTRGYGRFAINKKLFKASRIAFELWNGAIPRDKPNILHTCDVKACCNPEHLYAGTQSENNKDSWIRNRRKVSEFRDDLGRFKAKE